MADNFYISFGGASPLAKHLVEVQAESRTDARYYAHKYFKDAIWCAVYPAPEAMEMAREYDLTIIKAAQ